MPASKKGVVERILLFNRDRKPDMVERKYKAMRTNAFSFFRGTCHLFYEDWPARSPLNDAPPAWICGDLHLENFGSYKGDNRLTYFDINDFDEAALAPCTWDMARLLTSILVGADSLKVDASQAKELCQHALDCYTTTLAKGHIHSVERATATGMVKTLLYSLKTRKRKDFLNQHTRRAAHGREIVIDGKHTLPASDEEKEQVKTLIEGWAKAHPEKTADYEKGEDFFNVRDVAHRIAGTGSLGVARYVILVEGNGSPNENFLLDLKEQPACSLQPYLKLPQPDWPNQAERRVHIQRRFQGTPPALLSAIPYSGKAYVLHELQPLADRVNLISWDGKIRRLEKLVQTMADITAWDELRSSGRQGSATADVLMAFAAAPRWQSALMKYAEKYAGQVESDFKEFAAAYDAGQLTAKDQ